MVFSVVLKYRPDILKRFFLMIRSILKFNQKISMSLVQYFPSIFGSNRNASEDLYSRIKYFVAEIEPKTVMEIGGIDRPLLEKSLSYKYLGMDIDFRPDCNLIYDEFFVQSIEQQFNRRSDLIISKTLLEHVKDNKKSITNMHEALNDGGLMVHYVPSKYHPYSLLLRLVGHHLQKVLITALRPEAAEVSGYLAFFNLCSPRQMRRACEKAGFKDIKITCYYRATDYFSFFIPAFIVVALWENICSKFCLETMAAGFIIEARK